MAGKGGNVKDFSRPADKGDRMRGVHDNRLENREMNYKLMGNYVNAPMEAAGARATNAGARKGSGSQKPRKGPEHSRTKGIVKRGKK